MMSLAFFLSGMSISGLISLLLLNHVIIPDFIENRKKISKIYEDAMHELSEIYTKSLVEACSLGNERVVLAEKIIKQYAECPECDVTIPNAMKLN